MTDANAIPRDAAFDASRDTAHAVQPGICRQRAWRGSGNPRAEEDKVYIGPSEGRKDAQANSY